MNLAIKTDIVFNSLGNLNYINVPVNMLASIKCNVGDWWESQFVRQSLNSHTVALIGWHSSVGVVEGSGGRRGSRSTVAQHELRLGLCNRRTVRRGLW